MRDSAGGTWVDQPPARGSPSRLGLPRRPYPSSCLSSPDFRHLTYIRDFHQQQKISFPQFHQQRGLGWGKGQHRTKRKRKGPSERVSQIRGASFLSRLQMICDRRAYFRTVRPSQSFTCRKLICNVFLPQMLADVIKSTVGLQSTAFRNEESAFSPWSALSGL